MSDWTISNSRENNTGNWVYYVCTVFAQFANIHFSRHVDVPGQDHMATNDNQYYYYGVTGTFNTPNMPASVRQTLVDAWNNYFTV